MDSYSERVAANVAEAKDSLTGKPWLAADAERINAAYDLCLDYEQMPFVDGFAKCISGILSRVSTPVDERDLIAGRVVDRELTPEEEEKFKFLCNSPHSPFRSYISGSGHCAYDWQMILDLGLPGLIGKARASMDEKKDEGRRAFLSAVIAVYTAIQDYILRYSAEAKRHGMTDLAETLCRAATEKPSDFRTALQLLWLITLIDCSYVTANPTLTVGRMDSLLWPFYKADIECGRLTREEAADLITDYYCKHNLNMGRGEHQIGHAESTTFARIFNFDAPQYLLLGGSDSNGRAVVNDLTYLFAECIVPEFKNPVVVFYYVPGTDREHPGLWRTIADKALRSSSLMIYNDAVIKRGFRALGLPEEDFRDYHHFGCNWISPGYHSGWVFSGPTASAFGTFESEEERKEASKLFSGEVNVNFNNVRSNYYTELIRVLKELSLKEDACIEDLYREFFRYVRFNLKNHMECMALIMRVRRRKPWLAINFTDCFTRGSIERGEAVAASGRYSYTNYSFKFFATAVDCFTAVDRLVFREHTLTLKELMDAVDDDFVGHEKTLALCRSVPKFGSDDPLSNAHAERLARTFADTVSEIAGPYIKSDRLFVYPSFQTDTMHLSTGTKSGATPDGRRAGTAFSQSTRPVNGACVNGLTGMFNSLLHIPFERYLSGGLNVDVDAGQFAGEEGRDAFAALLALYFNRGGLQTQVTAVSTQDLIDAQKDPQSHRDLRVRVTGYSGVFVDLTKKLQDDIIERSKQI